MLYVATHSEQRMWLYTQFCAHYKAYAGTMGRTMREHLRCKPCTIRVAFGQALADAANGDPNPVRPCVGLLSSRGPRFIDFYLNSDKLSFPE